MLGSAEAAAAKTAGGGSWGNWDASPAAAAAAGVCGGGGTGEMEREELKTGIEELLLGVLRLDMVSWYEGGGGLMSEEDDSCNAAKKTGWEGVGRVGGCVGVMVREEGWKGASLPAAAAAAAESSSLGLPG